MKYGTRINKLNTESKSIIEYLIERRKLNSENLFFVLNIVKDATLITPKVLCDLIELNDFVFIEEILQFKYYDKVFIVNFLLAYNNKTKRSKTELQIINNFDNTKININNKTETGFFPFLKAISLSNIEIIKLFMEYTIKNNITIELNKKDINGNYPLSEAIKEDNIEIDQLLIEYANKHNIILEINEKDEDG